MNECQEYSN